MRAGEKLISGGISKDAGIMLNISSNSVTPSMKAYCPLMENLQHEFHFFIKNQQAKAEKMDHLRQSLSLTHMQSYLLLHFSSLSTTVRQFITIIIFHPHPLPVERENSFWSKVQNVTAT